MTVDATRDLVIDLRATVHALAETFERETRDQNITLTRLESKVDRINGDLTTAVMRVNVLEQRPIAAVGQAEGNRLIRQHEELWAGHEEWRRNQRGREEFVKEHQEMYGDYRHRQQEGQFRRWFVPVLVSTPAAVLSLTTLVYLFIGGR